MADYERSEVQKKHCENSVTHDNLLHIIGGALGLQLSTYRIQSNK